MLFSSISFVMFFLPLVLLIYFIAPYRCKNVVLLLFSLLFYAWGEPIYVFLMICSILINYLFGIEIMNRRNIKKILLIFGVSINIFVLFYFKYLGFAANIIGLILGESWIHIASLIMPIGISFYTFQAISYLVDVYRNRNLGQENILDLGLYITLFPQLIAGPIIRYHDVYQQIKQRVHSWSSFSEGVERFIIGFAKKVILANNLAYVADKIFALSFEQYGTAYAWVAIVAYTLQIYYDFSGYSDMAIGLGKMFGFTFLENFNYPYMAYTVTDFWRRWHISLSRWFRDYVYIPLGGSHCTKLITYRNLYIVFFLTGLWHGASFNFIIWGLAHGTLLVLEKVFISKIIPGFWTKIILRIYTLLSVIILWVFFRIEGLEESFAFIYKLFGVEYYGNIIFANTSILQLIVPKNFYVLFIAGVLLSIPWWRLIKVFDNTVMKIVKYSSLIAIFIISLSYLAASSYNPFIYFRF